MRCTGLTTAQHTPPNLVLRTAIGPARLVGQLAVRSTRRQHLADARQGIAHQHIHNPRPPELRLQQYQAGCIILHRTNNGRVLP
jgi:hypothetical protein